MAAVVAFALVSNDGALRDGAGLLRSYGQATAADLGALDIGRPLVRPGYVLGNIPGYPLLIVRAVANLQLWRFAIAVDACPLLSLELGYAGP